MKRVITFLAATLLSLGVWAQFTPGQVLTATQLNSALAAKTSNAAAAITGGTITSTAVSGGTISSAAITGGTITSSAVTGGTVTSAAITGGTITSTSIGGTSYLAPTISTLAPAQSPSVQGSVGAGPIDTIITRTGGYGQYGNWLSQYLVTVATPSPQFDVGITSWLSHTNLTGGQAFGGWSGANTPSAGLAQTFTSGAAIGAEFNVGNRWADFGLQTDIAGTRYTVGVQIVPDVLPALDGVDARTVTGFTIASPGVVTIAAHGFPAGLPFVFGGTGTLPTGVTAGTVYYVLAPTTNTFTFAATYGGTAINTTGSFAGSIYVVPSYPGSFAEVIAPSIWKHKWWVGSLLRTDTINPTGYAYYLNGGSSALTQPDTLMAVAGFWNKGIDMSTATIATTAAIKLGASHAINIGSATISGGGTGAVGISTANAQTGTLYVNNFGATALQWTPTGVTITGTLLSKGAIGYNTGLGAGGTVAQATSRTTGVTLNTVTGQITLFSTTTTAGQTTTFTLTDSAIAATDTLQISQNSGTGVYFFSTKTAAGSAQVSVYTPTAVGSAEAPVLNFTVTKGSAS